MDVKLSQVLLETVIVQIELGDDLSTGVDWIKRGRKKGGTFANGDMMAGGGGSGSATLTQYNKGDNVSLSDAMATLKNAGIKTDDMSADQIIKLAKENSAMFSAEQVSPIGAGLNYFLKSDKLDLSAVIQMAKSDSRSKVLASPILMTVDNKEATIEATDMIYLFSGYQYSGSSYNGTQVRNYEKRDIGLTVKVTPKINPNGTVMLTIEETFETQGADQSVPNESGGTDPYATVTTRKMSSDISVENRQTVVMGGLTRKSQTESESGIPILKDIPWIGKWLFGSVTQTDKRSELLVFITPYVLDDAESAQTEAIRRKKTLSDPRPWEDAGWSASPIADPVSRREQLRRFKDEWKRQDEERKIKLTIEKAKIERARQLEKMSEEERKAWIELHKEELDKEAKEAFDKKVKEQEDLKDFVETLKKRDLEQSEKVIKAADDTEKNSN
jgi:type II secretory pathway component GspD/PulD (secretin)